MDQKVTLKEVQALAPASSNMLREGGHTRLCGECAFGIASLGCLISESRSCDAGVCDSHADFAAAVFLWRPERLCRAEDVYVYSGMPAPCMVGNRIAA